ncbi:hypothetical protein SUDANB51_00225 [Streptomyces sp. enrichment culture]
MTRGGGQADAVACTGLTYAFGDTNAVDGLDLTVRPGEAFGLLGPNGAGKTTAIRCLTTLMPVPVRRLLGYVPQQLSADAGLTGRENVALLARVFDVPRRERAARVAQTLAAVDLAHAADRRAATYSGGMVRRLELAQALVSARACSSSTSPRSAWTRSHAPASGSTSAPCARPPA